MRKLILMTSAAIIAPMCAIAQTSTCTATPDCASLGYTEASCPNGGVKCPWGEAWACFSECKEPCYIGFILYSDKSCSMELEDNKTPIGVVVYIDRTGKGQALALNSLSENYIWGPSVDIPDLVNYTADSSASKDYDSCGNTAKILAAGDKNTYPAAWAAHEYSTEGTSIGDWCLPAGGIFNSYQRNFDWVNAGIKKAGGTTISNKYGAWSSSESDSSVAFASSVSSSFSYGIHGGDWQYYNHKTSPREVRPVIEF